jgi:hypothetical protein
MAIRSFWLPKDVARISLRALAAMLVSASHALANVFSFFIYMLKDSFVPNSNIL